MQRIRLALWVCCTLCAFASAAVAAEEALKHENALLRAEYELARKREVYLFLDIAKKQIAVRASGVDLTTVPIREIRSWGPFPAPGLHRVAEKDRVPEREKIQIPPAEGEPAPKPAAPPPADPAAPPVAKKFDIQATEVTDMPANYSLTLNGGGIVTVHTDQPGEEWDEKLRHRFERPLWRLTRAYTSVMNQRQNKTYTELFLIMNPHDAQRLYWAMPIGTALLIPPVDQP